MMVSTLENTRSNLGKKTEKGGGGAPGRLTCRCRESSRPLGAAQSVQEGGSSDRRTQTEDGRSYRDR